MTVSHTLPPTVIAALHGIHWSMESEGLPLHFKCLAELERLRGPAKHELFSDIAGVAESFSLLDTSESRHFGTISLALLLIGHDLTDECHDLITPLSWPDDIHFAHGPSIYSQASHEVQAFASYAHCLVHRKEAFHRGEFGMIGFQNANYWSNAVGKSNGAEKLPHGQLRQQVKDLACQFSGSSTVQEWCTELVDPENEIFDARPVHQLCASVLRQNPTNRDLDLRAFAEKVAEAEIRILLSHTLRKAGFEFDDFVVLRDTSVSENSETLTDPAERYSSANLVIDNDAALTAMRRVSSAHLDLFRSQGSVALRQVGPDTISAAAGIACRLLEAPACRMLKKPTDTGIAIVVGDNEGSHPDLSDGDLLVLQSLQDGNSPPFRIFFEAVRADDTSRPVTFRDPLFGTRGDTPTSVLQWSKGTIF